MSKEIPWKTLLNDSLALLKTPDRNFVFFAITLFLLAIPGQWQLFEKDWHQMDSLQFWLWTTEILCFLATSYFIFVAFILWIKSKANQMPPIPLKVFLKTSMNLMLPLSILSIRGAILTALGFLGLIVPGIYFAFKYELASFCIILEGWSNQYSPVSRAEQLTSKYGKTLAILIGIMILDWTGAFLFEISLKFLDVHSNTGMKIAMAAIETCMAIFFDVYLTFIVLFLIKNTEPPIPAEIQKP